VPSSDPIQRFSDIVENIERIERFTAGMNLQAFAAAEQTILAAKYALLTISEAATKLGDIANQLCPEISMAGNPGSRESAAGRLREHRCGPYLAVDRARPAASEGRLQRRAANPQRR